MLFTVSDSWRTTYPGAAAGFLVIGDVVNPEAHPALEEIKTELENELRARFSNLERSSLQAIPPFPAYAAYYRHFKKTYHVYLQLESIVFKAKSIPTVASLVEAMFMAELKNGLLTAGHDLDVLEGPVRLDVAKGNEQYITMNNQDQVLKRDDMFISDTHGIISDIIYGPDSRTRMTPATHHALFTVYAPPGIGEEPVYNHLQDIRRFIGLFSLSAEVETLSVINA